MFAGNNFAVAFYKHGRGGAVCVKTEGSPLRSPSEQSRCVDVRVCVWMYVVACLCTSMCIHVFECVGVHVQVCVCVDR